MSQGILYADVINTVSPTYAREILTPEYSEGLDPVLKYRKARIFGILNGLDTVAFNPASDAYLQTNYDVKSLERKVENKLALQREGNLEEDPSVPVVGIVSRLADQKGFDLLEPIIEPLLKEVRLQLVLLGTGDQHYHDFFRRIGEQYPGQAAIALNFDVALLRAVEAFHRPEEWRQLQQRGMQADLSWSVSAQRYVELYRKAQEFKVTG